MKRLILVAIMLLTCVGGANAESLTPIMLANGENSFPCDGENKPRMRFPVHANIVKVYLFAGTDSAAVDMVVVPDTALPINLQPTLADIHHIDSQGPLTGGWSSGSSERSFSPDSVYVDQLTVNAICYGAGKTMLIYLVIYTRNTP